MVISGPWLRKGALLCICSTTDLHSRRVAQAIVRNAVVRNFYFPQHSPNALPA